MSQGGKLLGSCRHCGSDIFAGKRFCGGCGSMITSDLLTLVFPSNLPRVAQPDKPSQRQEKKRWRRLFAVEKGIFGSVNNYWSIYNRACVD